MFMVKRSSGRNTDELKSSVTRVTCPSVLGFDVGPRVHGGLQAVISPVFGVCLRIVAFLAGNFLEALLR